MSERGNAILKSEIDRPFSAGPVLERTVSSQETIMQNKHTPKNSLIPNTDLQVSMESELDVAVGDAIQQTAPDCQQSTSNHDQQTKEFLDSAAIEKKKHKEILNDDHTHEAMDKRDNVEIRVEKVAKTTLMPDGSIDIGLCQMAHNTPNNRRNHEDPVPDFQTNHISISKTTGPKEASSRKQCFNIITKEDEPRKSTANNCNLNTTAIAYRTRSISPSTCNSK